MRSIATERTLATASGPERVKEQAFEPTVFPAGSDATVALGAARVGPDARGLAPIDRGRYAIGREIARGGMGRISVARDCRLGRPVALKELLVDSHELRARFEREARITAQLQHPAIVSLLEAGAWPSGEPFYVMKLVSGESLDKVIATRPTLDARLALLPHVIAVVDALAYAHAMRVVHRDLKPANVLVGEFGETVVVDWGLAKDLADASGEDRPASSSANDRDQTQMGSILGTPAYMPLEQALGEPVDERADVYALGAMLYHVLAGAPPYGGRTSSEVLDAVIAGPPAMLATRTEGVPIDLVTIVNKAMARNAADRYPTAKELVDDLKKFQTGQLVSSHHYSPWQLARRWLRRHRTTVAVGSIALVLLGLLAIASVRRIVDERERTEVQRHVAVQKGADADELLDFMMKDMRIKLETIGKLDLLDEVAKKAITYYDRKGEQLTLDERAKRSIAQRNLGKVLFQQGHADAALEQFRAGLDNAYAVAAGRPADLGARGAIAQSHLDLGDALKGKHPGVALGHFRVSLAMVQSLARNGDSSRDQAGKVHERIAKVLFDQGDAAGALIEYRQALAADEARVGADPSSAAAQARLANQYTNIARVQVTQGDTDGALAMSRKALAMYEALAARAPESAMRRRDLLTGHSQIGDLLVRRGDVGGALAELRTSVSLAKELAANDPTNASRLEDLALCHQKLGAFLTVQGDLDEARVELTASRALNEQRAALDPNNDAALTALSISHFRLGNLALALKDHAKALVDFDAYVTMSEQLAARDPASVDRQRNVAVGQVYVGNVLLARKDPAAALVRYRRALATFEKRAAKDPTNLDRRWDVTEVRDSIGDALLALHEPGSAEAEYRASMQIRMELTAKGLDDVSQLVMLATSHGKIAATLLAQNKKAAALAEYRAGLDLAMLLKAKSPDNNEVAQQLAVLKDRVAACCAP
jgi:tetratricopeptide (TPR) repeat protein